MGVALAATGPRADGEVLLDYLRWDGPPELVLRRPAGDGNFWHMAWVNGASQFATRFPQAFRISQARGAGIIIHGTRQWSDYTVAADVVLHLGSYGGVAVRVQGLRRYYLARITRAGRFEIVRVRDEDETILADAPFATELERPVALRVSACGRRIEASADGSDPRRRGPERGRPDQRRHRPRRPRGRAFHR